MRFPDLHGIAGKGWNVTPVKHEYTLASWFAEIPGAHPLWSWYVIHLVHLRGDVPDQGPPNLHYPEAEFEIMIYALDPDEPHPPINQPLTDKGIAPAKMLTPQNLCKQFHGVPDHTATKITELLVSAFVNGVLNPDTDGTTLIKNAIDQTVLHFQGKSCTDDTLH